MKRFKIDPEEQIKEQIRIHSAPEKQNVPTGGWIKGVRRRKNRIALIRQLYPLANKILCVGARADDEILAFTSARYDAIGIDISNATPHILSMDAHEMTFADSQFDVCYCNHSLEHMHTPEIVMGHIRRTSSMGCVITLPTSRTANRPSANHTSIFDIMIEPQPTDDTLRDFDPLRPFTLLKFMRIRAEFTLFLGWNR